MLFNFCPGTVIIVGFFYITFFDGYLGNLITKHVMTNIMNHSRIH